MLKLLDLNVEDIIKVSLTFSTNNNGTMTEVMRITQEGNVGIGTTEPLSKLSVGEDGNCVLTIENTTESIKGFKNDRRNMLERTMDIR